MKNVIRSIVCVAILGAAVLSAGCQDPNKERIALLEEENARLLDDSNAAQDELAAIKADLGRCQEDLLAARHDTDALRGRLAEQPEVPQGWQAIPGGAMIAIPGSVLFDSGKAALRSGANSTLNSIVSTIQSTYPDKEILVYGHTDDEPISKSKWTDNFELSAQRALSVVRALEQDGISSDRLVAAGCGEHRPVVPNSSATNRQKNRRVEIYAMDPSLRTAAR